MRKGREVVRLGTKGVSVRKLVLYRQCPHKVALTDQYPPNPIHSRCYSMFRKAVTLCRTSGYTAAADDVARFIERGSKRERGLRTRVQGWLGDFYGMMAGGRVFGPGIQRRVRVGAYQLRLDVHLVEDLGDGTQQAWLFHDFDPDELGQELADFGIRLVKHVLAVTEPAIKYVAFYDYKAGRLSAVDVRECDADLESVSDAETVIAQFVRDREFPKIPGSYCQSCWHYRQKHCNGVLPG